MEDPFPSLLADDRLLLLVRPRSAHVTFELRGELDAETTPLVQDAIDLVHADRPRDVVVDLRRVGTVDAAALRQLGEIRIACQERGTEFLAFGAPAPVLAAFLAHGAASLLGTPGQGQRRRGKPTDDQVRRCADLAMRRAERAQPLARQCGKPS
jgi:anti-anti-sigma factor